MLSGVSNICGAHGASDALGCIGVFTHADGSFGRKRRERDDPPGAKAAWLESEDLIVDAEQLATLSELDDPDLRSKLSALAVFEERVSADRRAIHGVIDRLQQELVRRYKTGEATIDGLLT